ncbi:hypothetical protein BTW01_02015 [Bacillus sp. SKDU12]|nr:hypothetical protein BTW01_02015 [Bacillus sp. SKDU12]
MSSHVCFYLKYLSYALLKFVHPDYFKKKTSEFGGEFCSPLSNEKTGCWMATRLFYYKISNVCL